MPVDREEELVVLFALHKCGGKGTKHRIIGYILEEQLIRPRAGDNEIRESRETKIENDLAWSRENLKKKGWLSMPEHGVWRITEAGRQRLFKVAKAAHEKKPKETDHERYSQKFLDLMVELGEP